MRLKPEDYYTQRNNITDPNGACMPTARAMFYIANNIEFKNDSKYPADEYFMRLLRTKDAYIFAQNKYPELAKLGYPPNMIHGMYHSYLDHIVCGKQVSDFHMEYDFDTMVRAVETQAVMTSVTFPQYGIKGHAIVFTDVIDGKLFASDPFGNPHFGYRGENGKKGYAVEWDREYYDKYCKGYAHILRR